MKKINIDSLEPLWLCPKKNREDSVGFDYYLGGKIPDPPGITCLHYEDVEKELRQIRDKLRNKSGYFKEVF